MRSMRVQAFLSCSFDPADRNVVDFFASLCRGVDIACVNVDKGYASTPPDKARELIADSQLLVAVATRREEVRHGVFNMPKAVDEEMSMAYANKKPILLFAEQGVDTSAGFVRNYCTYLEFDRANIWAPAFLEKALASIHTQKVDVISPQELQVEQQGQEHVYAESLRWLIELLEQPSGFTWRYSTTRRLVFTNRFTDPIKAAAWSTVAAKDSAGPDSFKFSYVIVGGSKPFQFVPTEEKHTCDCYEVSMEMVPKPEAGDILEYSTVFESPYLNPVYIDDIKEQRTAVTVNGQKFLCFDGAIPIVRSQELRVQLRLPASLGLGQRDLAPFVGSFTNKVDYLVQSEMTRMQVTTTSFGGSIVVDIATQSPLLQHVYGVAWNPPKRP